jgi:hypothetical protein
MIRIRMQPTPDRLAIPKNLLFLILTLEGLALFSIRLAGTLQFNGFAFSDTGSNLTEVYLVNHGYRPTIDFIYHYGLLPLLLGKIWFRIWGLAPIACVLATPLIDILIAWGIARFAAGLKINVAGVLLVMLTASLTIPWTFLNFAHGLEPIFLIHALADQGSGNRRRALALTTIALFIKPSMAFFLGFVLIGFMVTECFRGCARPLRAFLYGIYPAVLTGTTVAIILAANFGLAIVVRSMIPTQGLTMYREQAFGFFNGAGRSFIATQGASFSYYFMNIAGPWIVYTIVLVLAALFAVRTMLACFSSGEPNDWTREIILSCAVLHLSFIFFFFGNEFSWIYYFYIPVLGLAAAARLGIRWEVLVACVAFAVPIVKIDKRIVQHLNSSGVIKTGNVVGNSAQKPSLPAEAGFTYQFWYTTSPSPETAGLWTASNERDEWIKVLAMIRGHRAAMLEYEGCADLLFPEFSPPVTLFLVPGGVTKSDTSRKLSQLRTCTRIVMPRWHSGLLDDIPEIGELMRRDFVPIFQGASFIVYARENSLPGG